MKQSKLTEYKIIEEIGIVKYLAGFEKYTYEIDNKYCKIINKRIK